MQSNRVARILGIEKPVVQGPLSWLTDARLVAAVGSAGGLSAGPERRADGGNRCLHAGSDG